MSGKEQPGTPVANYLTLGPNPVGQLNALVRSIRITEEGLQPSEEASMSFSSIMSEDEFVILDKEDDDIDVSDDVNTPPPDEESGSVTDNLEPSGHEGTSKSRQHPLPLTSIQQRFLHERPSARRKVLKELEERGYTVTFDFDHGNVDIETQGSEGPDKALSILRNSVLELNVDFTEEELLMMTSDIPDGEPVIPLPLSSSDQEILVVINRSEGNMKLIGLADDVGEVREQLSKSQKLLHPAQARPDHVPQDPITTDRVQKHPNVIRSGQSGSVLQDFGINQSLNEGPQDAIISQSREESGQRASSIGQKHHEVQHVVVVPVRERILEYLTAYGNDEIFSLATNTNDLTIRLVPEGIEIKGSSEAVNAVAMAVEAMIGQMRSDTFSFKTGVNMARFTEASLKAGQKHKVAITYHQSNLAIQGGSRAVPQVAPQGGSPERTLRVGQDIKVNVVLTRIETQQADVVVNTTNKKLNLSDGKGVSKSLWMAAGDTIQQELRILYKHGIGYGELAVSGPGRLTTCKNIYHAALPNYRGGGAETMELSRCYEYLVSVVFQSLIRASTEGYQTIAFPVFGAGALEYPVKNVVQLMFKAIDRFNQDKRAGSINEIFIVISPETRSEVKQLFLAHQLTHYMKTRHLKYPEEREGLIKKLFYPGRGHSAAGPSYFQTEVSKTHQPKCEVRAKIGDTLLQVIHGDIRKSCDVIDTVMVPWIGEEIRTPNDQPGLRCIDPNRKQWPCSSYVMEFPKTECVADSTTLNGKTLIHTYCNEATEKCMVGALLKGLKTAAKEKISTVTIPLPTESSMAANPSDSVSAIVSAIYVSRSGVDVVTVIIRNDHIFVDFVTKLAGMKRLEEPADISMTKFVDTLWSVTHSNQAVRSQIRAAAFKTGVDAKMMVTSDSAQRNRAAAQEVANELKVELCAVST